jgi:hypothetical protein
MKSMLLRRSPQAWGTLRDRWAVVVLDGAGYQVIVFTGAEGETRQESARLKSAGISSAFCARLMSNSGIRRGWQSEAKSMLSACNIA